MNLFKFSLVSVTAATAHTIVIVKVQSWLVDVPPKHAALAMRNQPPETHACVVSQKLGFTTVTCFSMSFDALSWPPNLFLQKSGCGYLNGVGPVIGSQMLVMIGLLFSMSALGDCSFVALDNRLFLPEDLDIDLPIEVTQTQYIGFLTWQRLDG
jgi:hypothetical protein